MIGIIGAMEEEVAEIKEYMDVSDSKSILDCTFYHGTIEGNEVVLVTRWNWKSKCCYLHHFIAVQIMILTT